MKSLFLKSLATRNSQLATRNSQLATRNSQLATRNSQLATAIALASALLLSACGGSSSSSGDEAPINNVNNPTNTTNQPDATAQEINTTPAKKIDAMADVYWKGNCVNKGDGSSQIHYMHTIKQADGSLKITDRAKQYFSGGECATKTKLVFDDKENIITTERLNDLTFQDENTFVVVSESKEGGRKKEIFTRLSKNEYPKP